MRNVHLAANGARGAKRMNVTECDYGRLAFKARVLGIEMGSVESAFRRMECSINSAVSGDPFSLSAFKTLGVAYPEITTICNLCKFTFLTERIFEIVDTVKRTTTAQDIFGKNYHVAFWMHSLDAKMETFSKNARGLGIKMETPTKEKS